MNFSREALVMMHVQSKRMKETDPEFTRVFGSMPYYPEESLNSSMPNVEVTLGNRITIEDIKRGGPNKVHEGKFLLCRSLAQMWGVAHSNYLVVDDPDGKYGINILLYNFKGTVPVGAAIALMNPWIKSSATGSMSLRVDNPDQCVVLEQSHPLLRDVVWRASLPYPDEVPDEADWRAAGGRYFNVGNYEKALECYTNAIETDNNNSIHYANRSLAYLMLNKPEQALSDTDKGLQLDPGSVKLVYRKARALMDLKRYEECVSFLEKQTTHLSNPEFVSLLQTASEKLAGKSAV